MEKTLWALETDGSVEKVFADLNKAKEYAYGLLQKWGYLPHNDGCGVFAELEDSFNDETYSGFWVDQLIYCYEVEYVE